MPEQEPKLHSNLQQYEKPGYVKISDKELGKAVEENKEKRIMKKGSEKVKEAVEKGEIKFGGIESKKVSDKKPSFEEYKAKQQAKQEEVLEKTREAREELEKKYEELEKIKRAA